MLLKFLNKIYGIFQNIDVTKYDKENKYDPNNNNRFRGIAEINLAPKEYPIIRGDSLYTIVEGPTWTEAEANANKLGGHLVTINDQEENEFIQKLKKKSSQI